MKKRILSVLVSLIVILSMTSITAAAAAVDEQEPNDSKAASNTVKMGAVVYGCTDNYDYMSGSSGHDWFKFTAPISGTAVVKIYGDGYASDGPRIRGSSVEINVYDGNGNTLVSKLDSPATDSGASATFGVTSGKTYYLRVSGYHYGFYDEDVEYHFSTGYSIGKISIRSVSGKSKAFKVKWQKKSKASFYQVQYVKKSSYDDYAWKKAKIVKVSSKSGSKTINKLSKNKKYFVRVRVARIIDGVTYYSSWSPKKIARTK